MAAEDSKPSLVDTGAADARPVEGSSDSQIELARIDSKAPPNPQKDESRDPYQHLSPEEAAIIKRQVQTPDVKVGLAALYRYATRVDLILLATGAFFSITAGAIMPLMTVVFGSLQNTFAGVFNGSTTYDGFMAEMTHLVLYFVYLGIGMFFATYIATTTFIYTGEHIADKIREHYLESCLKQNIVSAETGERTSPRYIPPCTLLF